MRELRTDPAELDQLMSAAPEEGVDPQLLDALRLVIDNLEEPNRSVLEMFFWQSASKATIGAAFGCKSNLQTTRLIDRAVEAASEALRLYLEVGKVPTASGRRKTPKAMPLPRRPRRPGIGASQRSVPREGVQGAHRIYVVVPL